MSIKEKSNDKLDLAKNIFIDILKGGFGVVLPTFGMIYIIQFIFLFIVSLLSPVSNFLSKFLMLPDFLVTVFSGFLVLFICFLCGFVLKTKLGKISYFFYEKILKKLKIYKIFNVLQEIYNQFFSKKQKSFSESVLCFPYGRDKVAFSGLISSRWRYNNINYISVFIPTCPNFTSGFLKHIPEEYVDILPHIPVDQMMRTIIACGAGTSDLIEKNEDMLQKEREI